MNKIKKCKQCRLVLKTLYEKNFDKNVSLANGYTKDQLNHKGAILYNNVCEKCKPYCKELLKGLEGL